MSVLMSLKNAKIYAVTFAAAVGFSMGMPAQAEETLVDSLNAYQIAQMKSAYDREDYSIDQLSSERMARIMQVYANDLNSVTFAFRLTKTDGLSVDRMAAIREVYANDLDEPTYKIVAQAGVPDSK